MIFQCDFEDDNNPLCSMTQAPNDKFDWTRQNGPTPSANTGPNADHTLGNIRGILTNSFLIIM